jgi:oligoribonuclease
MKSDKNTNLFWVDLEMTGLDPNSDVITEIACLVTNSDLEILAEGPNLVIHQDDDQLEKIVNDVNKIYDRSGLKELIKKSDITLEYAEKQVSKFISEYCNPGKSPYCGNTVSTDKQFIKKYMPSVYNQLHYRVIDVSSVKELAKRWYLDLPLFVKAEKHRALDDIKESIAELKYYRENIFLKKLE